MGVLVGVASQPKGKSNKRRKTMKKLWGKFWNWVFSCVDIVAPKKVTLEPVAIRQFTNADGNTEIWYK
jgi:hypothetical protein